MKSSSLLGHASELFQRVRSSGRPADSVIDSFFRSHKYLGSHDRRFIAETTYGTLRHLRLCEHLLLKSLGEDAQGILPADGTTLLLVAYLVAVERRTKLIYADLEPVVKSGKLRHHLRTILNTLVKAEPPDTSELSDPIARIGLRYSFPDWMIARFIDQYGVTQTETLCKSLNEQAPVTLRANILKATVEECQKALAAEGIGSERTKLSPVGLQLSKRLNVFQLQAFRNGLFEVQDEGSQLLPLIVDPKPTAKVLDACAGAGGKTLHLAAIMKNRGEIVAADVHSARLEELRKRARRADVSNVRIQRVEDVADLEEKYRGRFDVVIVDAPCSGIGTVRRNPGMKWMVSEETVQELSQKQRHILEACASLVAPGGRIAYATCTLFREENEEVVEAFLELHREFALATNLPAASGLDASSLVDRGYVRLFPHRDGTDGFFIAVLQKQGQTN